MKWDRKDKNKGCLSRIEFFQSVQCRNIINRMSKNSVFIEQMTNMLIRPSRDVYPSDQLGTHPLTKVQNSSSLRENSAQPHSKPISISTAKSTEKTKLYPVKEPPYNCHTTILQLNIKILPLRLNVSYIFMPIADRGFKVLFCEIKGLKWWNMCWLWDAIWLFLIVGVPVSVEENIPLWGWINPKICRLFWSI